MDREDLRSWDRGLGDFVMAYRGFPHASTGISPYKLTRGHDMTLPWEFPADTPVVLPDLDPDVLQLYAAQLCRHLKGWHEHAIAAMTKTQERKKNDFNARHLIGSAYEFAMGEWVYVRTRKNRKNKLSPDYQAFKDPSKKTALLDVPNKGVRQRGVKSLVPSLALPEIQQREATRAWDIDMVDMWR